MPDLQYYLFILLGFVLLSAVILSANTNVHKRSIQFVKTMLIVKIGFYAIMVLYFPFPMDNLVAKYLYSGYNYAFDSLYAGIFIGYYTGALFFKKKWAIFNASLFPTLPDLYKWFKRSAISTFIFASIGHACSFEWMSNFFSISGYRSHFLIFIIIIEFICAIGLFFRKTTLYAAVTLIAIMAGATYTHYHNYFSKHLPDPLGNSIQSLITQAVLLSIVILTLYLDRKAAKGG